MGNVTRNQWLQIIGIVLGSIVASSALWTQLFGTTTAQSIVSVTGFLSTVLSGVTYVLTGQGQQVKDVAAMPGVQSITVNSAANQTVAQLAVDKSQNKIVPNPSDANTVQATAKGN